MINIAKLLKDAPKGMKLYSPLFGEVEFVESESMITVKDINGVIHMFFLDGKFSNLTDAECLLFPSKEVRTWEGWKLPVEPKFKVGDKVIYNGKERTITFMDDTFYDFDGGCAGCRIEKQDELLSPAPKPHYDIANFNPFDHCRFKPTEAHDWIYADLWYVQAHYIVEQLFAIEKWES